MTMAHQGASVAAGARTLLWVDDYEPALGLFKLIFERRGYRVLTATRGSAAINLAATNSIDAVVVDYQMPEMDGGMVAQTLKTFYPSLPVVMFSASSVPNDVLSTVDAFCEKSAPRNVLVDAIDRVIAQSRCDLEPCPSDIQPDPARHSSERLSSTIG
jgi:CheY-like chemotaxis protein